MYAVISTGGKQYRVSEGSVFRVENLEAEAGANVEFDQVLLVGQGDSENLGPPFLDAGKVTATIQSHGKGDKVRIVKFRRRKHYKREKTHRQPTTQIKVTGIIGKAEDFVKAHKKAGGSTRNGRDSQSKRLGVKKFGGQKVVAGNIIVRQ